MLNKMQGYILVILTVLTIVYAGQQCDNAEHGESVKHENDCTKFYVCNHKEAVLKSCAFNLHFNAKKKYCQSKASAGCDLTETTIKPDPTKPTNPTPTNPTPTNPTPTNPNPTNPTPTNPNPTNPNPTPTKPAPTPSPTTCANQKLGKNLPYQGDCTKYITCVGRSIPRRCAPGTHFNAKLEVCDWPERANCPWR